MAQRVYCPKCRNPNTINTGQSKIGFSGYRKIMMKHKCKECKYEFWR